MNLAEDLHLRKAKINLTYGIKTVLNSGLSILGLEAPEKM
jgi:arginyl-tRNA synthetase